MRTTTLADVVDNIFGTTRERAVTRTRAALGSATAGRLVVTSGVSRLVLSGDTALADLYTARFSGTAPEVNVREGYVGITYSRFSPLDWLMYLREPGATLALNSRIPWRLDLRGGVSQLDADFSDVALSSLSVAGGVSHVRLQLSQPQGAVPIRFGGGASQITIMRPANTAIRIRIDGGVSNLSIDDQYLNSNGGGLRWATDGYKDATNYYDIHIVGGASQVRLDTD